jgi:hypothetical protein
MKVELDDVGYGKITYKYIQKYVEEKYGVKVHTKYNAEVKRLCGIDEMKVSNITGCPARKYSKCPKKIVYEFRLIELFKSEL